MWLMFAFVHVGMWVHVCMCDSVQMVATKELWHQFSPSTLFEPVSFLCQAVIWDPESQSHVLLFVQQVLQSLTHLLRPVLVNVHQHKAARRISGRRSHLPASLLTWVQSPGTTHWMERTDSHKLPSDLHSCHAACMLCLATCALSFMCVYAHVYTHKCIPPHTNKWIKMTKI